MKNYLLLGLFLLFSIASSLVVYRCSGRSSGSSVSGTVNSGKF